MNETVPGWQEAEGRLMRHYQFENFKQALDFVNKVGALAEIANHHPDMTFGWGYAGIVLTTHDAGHTLTDKDFELAKKINEVSG